MRLTRNFLRITLVGSCVWACEATPRPSDADLYAMVLERASEELDLPDSLTVHPLPALWGSRDDLYAALTHFNVFDTLSVPKLVERHPVYRICTPSAAGICQPEAGEATIILSEIRDLGPKTSAVRLIVNANLQGTPFQRHYFSRVATGITGWSIVEFREIPKTVN